VISEKRRHLRAHGENATVCGRTITTEGGLLEVWPEEVLERHQLDLVAWAWTTCIRCRQCMAHQEVDDAIERLESDGMSRRQIGARLGLHGATIGRILKARSPRRAA
jgi:hypothetical protein